MNGGFFKLYKWYQIVQSVSYQFSFQQYIHYTWLSKNNSPTPTGDTCTTQWSWWKEVISFHFNTTFTYLMITTENTFIFFSSLTSSTPCHVKNIHWNDVEMTLKQLFPSHFNVEYMWCVRRVLVSIRYYVTKFSVSIRFVHATISQPGISVESYILHCPKYQSKWIFRSLIY